MPSSSNAVQPTGTMGGVMMTLYWSVQSMVSRMVVVKVVTTVMATATCWLFTVIGGVLGQVTQIGRILKWIRYTRVYTNKIYKATKKDLCYLLHI